MAKDSQTARTVLPIPHRGHVGLTTYDAKDPDTSFPPIEAVRPPAGALYAWLHGAVAPAPAPWRRLAPAGVRARLGQVQPEHL